MPAPESSLLGRGYLVRKQADAPTIPCPCGQSTRILTIADDPRANVHITAISDSVKHYHKECTEIYFILEGRGQLELGCDVVDVEPGTLVVIDPGTPHRLRSADGVRTLIVGLPALKPEDEYFDVD